MTTPSLDSKPQSWVPYQPTRDCSQGFCSPYCLQWCYINFPPPPPPPLDFSDDASGTAFSPLVIAIIAILASAFLLVSYYTIASKYWGNSSPFRSADDDSGGGSGGEVHHHEAWHVAVSEGLDEAVIKSITISKYKKGNGLVTDCSVCLTEFHEDENLRLLSKCGHAFHLQCIDTWLKSHSNCPLCRANVVAPTEATEPICDANYDTSIGDNDRDQDEASSDTKDPTRANVVIDIRDGRIQATSVRGSQVLISNVLEMGMEDDYSLAMDDGAGSSSQIDRYGLNNKVSTSTSS